jgi:hypothetical protein
MRGIRARRRLARLAPERRALLDGVLDRTRYGRTLRTRIDGADIRRTPAAFVRLSFASALAGAAVLMLWSGAPAGVLGFAG